MRHILEKLYRPWLVLLIALPTSLGFVYTLYQRDPYHWGFITATALDFIHGKRLFTETVVQYGAGQPLLFRLLNPILPVDYNMPGLVTSLVYGLTLFTISLGVRRITNTACAVLVSAAALLLHSYAIYPWPDYYGGFFLACAACILFSQAKEPAGMTRQAILGGMCMFLAFFFRNTYLLSLTAASVAYGIACLLRKNLRERTIGLALLTLWGTLLSYLAVLYLQGVLPLWYAQTIGVAAHSSPLSIPSTFLSLVGNALLVSRSHRIGLLVAANFSVLFLVAVVSILKALWRNTRDGVLTFLSLLGLAGMSQGAQLYEAFRLQNACVTLYPVFAAFLFSMRHHFQPPVRARALLVALGFYFLVLMLKFPYASSIYPLLSAPADLHSTTNIPLFHRHRFLKVDREFYGKLTSLLCNGKSRIVNLTLDSNIPYLCPGQENGMGWPFLDEALPAYPPDVKHVNEIRKGTLRGNEIVVTDTLPPQNPAAPWREIWQGEKPQYIRRSSHVYVLERADSRN